MSTRHVSTSVILLTWTATLAAALLVLVSVLTPLGLSDKVVPGKTRIVEFEYVKDPTLWGRITMPRPNMRFSRYCSYGLVVNCPGQYQGVYINQTEPGWWQNVGTDENSTISTMIPRNYTAMFTSATSDLGNTVSGLFDIQYRLWTISRSSKIDKGQPRLKGRSRHIESLIQQDNVLIREGLIIDTRNVPGIGFRNHTVPIGLDFGGLWSEDITWIEPITQCADTNISADFRTDISVEDSFANQTYKLVDRGAFLGLENSDIESRPWTDNQTLDLFAHAYKAARMYNVLMASSLNVTLPFNSSTGAVSSWPMGATGTISLEDFYSIQLSELKGFSDTPPLVPGYEASYSKLPTYPAFANLSDPFQPSYSDGMVKLLALNYTAIRKSLLANSRLDKVLTEGEQICEGRYHLSADGFDERAANMDHPAIKCGLMLGAPIEPGTWNSSASALTGVEASRKSIYVCATAYRASVKTVNFRYNGTGGDLSNLEVTSIAPKVYPNDALQPLWAVEHSSNRPMRFDPLWGIVNTSFENTDGFTTKRSDSLWLPASRSLITSFGETVGFDALAATGGFLKRLSSLYKPPPSLREERDYSGKLEFGLAERWSRLSQNQNTASQIPSLILTDGLAADLVGTKTSFTSKYVEWPASLAVDDKTRGFPTAKVQVYQRTIEYDIQYAIPSFLVLFLLCIALIGAAASTIIAPSIVRTMQNLYNQTSAGRLATNLLREDGDPTQPSSLWIKEQGHLSLAFGKVFVPEDDYFCKIILDESVDGDSQPQTVTEPAKAERRSLLQPQAS